MSGLRLWHGRWQRRTALLASGCLEGAERERAVAHLAGCDRCRRQHADVVAMLEVVKADPARTAESPLALSFLVTRVEARLTEAAPAPSARFGWIATGLAAALLAVAVVARLTPDWVGGRRPPTAPAALVTLDDAAMRRLERVMAREQAARYLADAEDVLVNLNADPRPCLKRHRHVELEAEARRSRELLARRALLLDLEATALAPARDVLEDVDSVLRDVSALRSCSEREDFERVRAGLQERRLLVKVRLLSKELIS